MNAAVKKATYIPERHLPLLLIADPDETMVARYIGESTLYEYVDGEQLLGVAAVTQIDAGTFELKNIAVATDAQRRGVGSKLLSHVALNTRPCRLIVGTADVSSEALSFYKRNGFREYGKLAGFFTDNYQQPVYDNGRLCRDMILLEWNGNNEH
jgi:ribosomal protein S18 acetylase RimI-like enzyme